MNSSEEHNFGWLASAGGSTIEQSFTQWKSENSIDVHMTNKIKPYAVSSACSVCHSCLSSSADGKWLRIEVHCNFLVFPRAVECKKLPLFFKRSVIIIRIHWSETRLMLTQSLTDECVSVPYPKVEWYLHWWWSNHKGIHNQTQALTNGLFMQCSLNRSWSWRRVTTTKDMPVKRGSGSVGRKLWTVNVCLCAHHYSDQVFCVRGRSRDQEWRQ